LYIDLIVNDFKYQLTIDTSYSIETNNFD